MNDILIRCVRILRQDRVKWPLRIVLTVALVVVHVVMHNKYAGTELAPSTEFTILVHSGIAVAIVLMVMYYKKALRAVEG